MRGRQGKEAKEGGKTEGQKVVAKQENWMKRDRRRRCGVGSSSIKKTGMLRYWVGRRGIKGDNNERTRGIRQNNGTEAAITE